MSEIFEAKFAQVQQVFASRDWAMSIKLCEELRELDPDDLRGWIKGAVALRNHGSIDESISLIDDGLAKFGKCFGLLNVQADTFRNIENWDASGEIYFTMRETYPNCINGFLGGIESLFRRGLVNSAIELVESAITLFGRKLELVVWSARLHFSVSESCLAWNEYLEVFRRIEFGEKAVNNIENEVYSYLRRVGRMVSVLHESRKGSSEKSLLYQEESWRRVAQTKTKHRAKVIVASIPKSGTHLVSKILDLIGYKFNGLFVNGGDCVLEMDNEFSSNRVYQYLDAPNFPTPFTNSIKLDLHGALALLRPGEHFLCHLPQKVFPVEWQPVINVIALVRSPRAALQSEFLSELHIYKHSKPFRYDPELAYLFSHRLDLETLFEAWLHRYGGDRFDLYIDMCAWAHFKNVVLINYDKLIGSSGFVEAQRIFQFLDDGSSIPFTEHDFDKVLVLPNPTKSERGHKKEDIWNKRTEAIFCEFGFDSVEEMWIRSFEQKTIATTQKKRGSNP